MVERAGDSDPRNVSAVLLDFAEPVLRTVPHDSSPKAVDSMLGMAWTVWNCVALDDTKGGSSLAEARARLERLPPATGSVLLPLFDELVERKRAVFGDDRRLFGELKVTHDPDGSLHVWAEAWSATEWSAR
jgi:hypothetical protein